MQLQTQKEVIKLLNRVTFFIPEVFLNESHFLLLTTANDWIRLMREGDLTARNKKRVYLRRAKQIVDITSIFGALSFLAREDVSQLGRLIKSE